MHLLSALFVGKPFNILGVALLFVLGYVVVRSSATGVRRRPSLLLVAATAWALYAVWEYAILVRTPEADIRVDLLLIWPILAIVSLVLSIKALRSRAL